MKNGSLRRSLAAASATAMAGAALVVSGVGVSSAAPATATHDISGNLVTSKFRIDRTVSEASPTYGAVVTLRTQVERTSLVHLLYKVRDFTPECLKYVPGSARWQATGGTVASEATSPGEFSRTTSYIEFAQGVGVTAKPFWMTADYTVECNAGAVGTGGTWIKRAPLGDDELGNANMGPRMSVQRKGTSVFLHQPTNPEVNQQVTLDVDTTNIPDGAQVVFTVDGALIGSGTVTGAEASVPWKPTSAGSKVISATFSQTGTHGGSTSTARTVMVSPINEISTVDVSASENPKVGQSTQLTASVSPTGAGGMVTFRANNAKIGEAAVQADGTATLSWIPQTSGLYTIDADFSGRPGVNRSNGATSMTVAEADLAAEATTTTIDPIATSASGGDVTLTATVSPSNASGHVSFYDGQALIGTSAVVNGVATVTWTPASEGARTIRAEFTPSGNFHPSQGTTQAIVTPQIVVPDPDPIDPGPGIDLGSLGLLTGSLGA